MTNDDTSEGQVGQHAHENTGYSNDPHVMGCLREGDFDNALFLTDLRLSERTFRSVEHLEQDYEAALREGTATDLATTLFKLWVNRALEQVEARVARARSRGKPIKRKVAPDRRLQGGTAKQSQENGNDDIPF